MATWVRVLANPKVLKRFFKSKAGKKVLFKYGKMLVKSKMIRGMIDRFLRKNNATLRNNKEYKKLEKEYESLQQRVDGLEKKLNATNENKQELETLAFTLGRAVVEMQQLLEKMQAEYQQEIRKVSVLQYAQKLR